MAVKEQQAPPASRVCHVAHVKHTARTSGSSCLGLIRSYLPADAPLTLSAVNPDMRVLTELVPNRDIPFVHRSLVKVCLLDNGEVVHALQPNPQWSEESHGLTEWWIDRCGLMIALDFDFCTKGVHLTRPYFQRLAYVWRGEHVKSLTWRGSFAITLRELSVKDAVFVSIATLHPRSVEGLTSLSLCGADAGGVAYASELRCLEHLRIRTNVRSVDMTHFSSADKLTFLEAITPQLSQIAGFHCCTALREVLFSICDALKDLSACGAAPALESVSVYCGGVEDISGLRHCLQLRQLTLRSCLKLHDVSALAGLPRLSTLNISGSNVQSIEGLGTCPSLASVDFSNCSELIDLSPLAGAPALTSIDAHNSGATVLTRLNTCKLLEKVDFDNCRMLRTLSPLGGAPQLQVVTARKSALNDVAGLGACPLLTEIDLLGCESLESLTESPASRLLRSAETPTAPSFADCRKLTYLNVAVCRFLTSLAPVAGAPNLRRVQAMHTAIRDLSGLDRCPKLEKLELGYCEQLSQRCKETEIPRLVNAGVVCAGV